MLVKVCVGRVVLNFFFTGLVCRGLGVLWQLFALPLLSKVSFNLVTWGALIIGLYIGSIS